MLTFVWFVVGLSVLLRRAEGEVPWRSAIVMGSGVLFVALGLSGLGNEAAVALRAGDLDPHIARYAFDQGQAALANGRVALGSFAVCCDHAGCAAPAPQLPRRRPVRLNPAQLWFMSPQVPLRMMIMGENSGSCGMSFGAIRPDR
jgi:hypothetical protein